MEPDCSNVSESENSSSDDDGSINDETDEVPSPSRVKRQTMGWCAATKQSQVNKRAEITWPPPSASFGGYNWRNLRPVRPGNPIFGTKMQLFSRTQHFLAVYADGTVRGTKDADDLHTHLELISTHYPGHVKIQGILTKLFVAINNKGRLYAESDPSDEATIFIEDLQGSYNTYLSKKYAHLGWYLGIKKSGKWKKGSKTAYGQKAIQFLPIREKFQ